MGAIPSGKGGERFPKLFPTQKAGFGGILGGGGRWRRPGYSSGRGGGGKEREGGGEGAARAQDIGLVAPARMARQACRASACGATGLSTSSPPRRSAGSARQRGHPVAPHALARQRLSVEPGQVARPNGLLPANKNQYMLKLKYY